MLTVRFPNGQAITYNNANQVFTDAASWDLYTDAQKTKWIASLAPSSGVILEATKPCRIENSAAIQTLESAANMVLENIHEVRGSQLAALKEKLTRFNRQSRQWRNK